LCTAELVPKNVTNLFGSEETKMKNETKLTLWLVLIVFVIAVGPLLSIWALNTLFPVLAIPYTLETWAAMALIGGVFRGVGVSKK
jgi:hypothetical protein